MGVLLEMFGRLTARYKYRLLEIAFKLLYFRGRNEYLSFGFRIAAYFYFEVIDFLEVRCFRNVIIVDQFYEFVGPSELVLDDAAMRDEVIFPNNFALVSGGVRLRVLVNDMPQHCVVSMYSSSANSSL
jgi:hypothetical protein